MNEMNRKIKKPKILLPKKLVPLRVCESDDESDSNNSSSLPLSSTMVEGKTRSARKTKRLMEEQISKIGENHENISKHELNSVVKSPEKKEKTVPSVIRVCDSFERHKTGCSKCSGSAYDPDATDDSEIGNITLNAEETSLASTEGNESDTDESSVHETGSSENTVVQPFCSSFNPDISQIRRYTRFSSESNISAISGLDQTSRFRIPNESVTGSSKSDESGAFKERKQKIGFDVIKLNDSGSKCEYQFVDGVHQRFCSSYLGNGFDVPSQIRFPCDPSLSAVTNSEQNVSGGASPDSDTTLTESIDSDNGEVPFCSSFRQDISQISSHMTFNLEEAVSDTTCQRYNLRKRKVAIPIQEQSESEEDESTLKPNSDGESNSESENDIQSSEAADKTGSCKWLTRHKLTCSICEADRNAGIMNKHISVHKGLKPYSCSTCKKSFSQTGDLKRHEQAVHEGRREHVCNSCGIAFGLKGNLQKHQKSVHGGSRDYICNTCGLAFGQKIHLKSHQQTVHEGRRDHVCSSCGIAFGEKSSLRVHQKTVHEGKRDHICSTCGIAFGRRCNLVRHERVTHQGKKDHLCTICGKAFGRKSQLTSHMETHGSERLFDCVFCDKKFKHRSNLSAHQAKEHRQRRDEDSDSN